MFDKIVGSRLSREYISTGWKQYNIGPVKKESNFSYYVKEGTRSIDFWEWNI